MQEIRGPGFPDSVPEDLVAVYGAQARSIVRYRRSWRYRVARRVGRLIGHRDPWYVAAAAGIWAVIVSAAVTSITIVSMRWPTAMLDVAVVLFAAACSSLLTAALIRRRAHRG